MNNYDDRLVLVRLSTTPQITTEESSSEPRNDILLPHSNNKYSLRSILDAGKSKLLGFVSLSNRNEEYVGEDGLCQPRDVNRLGNEMKESSRLANRLERDGLENPIRPFPLMDNANIQQIGPQVYNRQNPPRNVVPGMNLVVTIQQLEFHNHVLMLREERLAKELTRTYQSLEEVEGSGEFEYALRKALLIMCKMDKFRNDACVRVLEESKEETAAIYSNQDEVTSLYKELLSCISNMVSVEHRAYTAYQSILQKWQDVCNERTCQGFHCTSISLVKRQQEDVIAIDECDLMISQLLDSMDQMVSWIGAILVGNQEDSSNEIETLVKLVEVLSSTRSSRCHLLLTNDNDDKISSTVNNAAEQRRRRVVESEKFVAKLIINGQIVDSTSAKNVDWQCWKATFNQTFQCTMMKIPSSCCVQICQQRCMGMLPDKNICSVFISFPGCDSSKSTLNPRVFPMLAPNNGVYRFHSQNITSGIDGIIEVESMWAEATCATICNGYVHYPVVDMGAEKHRLQGTIARNSVDSSAKVPGISMIALNDDSMSFRMRGTRHSYLNPLRFQEPVRHYLIRRQDARRASRASAPLPLNEADISQHTIQNILADRKSSYRKDDDLAEAACKERPVANRESVMQYITNPRQVCQEKGCNIRPEKATFEDVVHDQSRIFAQDPSPDLSWIINIIIPPRKRSLYPRQGRISSVSKGAHLLHQSRIVLTVISALDAPLREEAMISSSTPFLASPPPIRRLQSDLAMFASPSTKYETSVGGMKRNQPEMSQEQSSNILNAVVQIKFCGKKYTTRPARKLTPSWKQVVEILLPFDEEESFTPQKMKDFAPIEVILFDLVDVDPGNRDEDMTTYTEKRYLGSVQVPLEILRDETNLHCCFIVNTPDVLFGYTNRMSGLGVDRENFSARTTHRFNDEELQLESDEGVPDHSRRKKSIALKMVLGIEPRPQFKNEAPIIVPGGESSILIQNVIEWMKIFIRINPRKHKRHFPIFLNTNSKSIFVTRVLQAQAPPPECQASLSQCVHYVSLLPCLSTWKAFASEFTHDTWQSSQEVLNLVAGNWCSRATLLANFFLYLNGVDDSEKYDVYLVFGNSVVEGKAVYVMTKPWRRDTMTTLWNPSTGCSFSEDDEKCPLYNISALVSNENIYGNIQEEGMPSLMDFNVLDRKFWHPYFGQGTFDQEQYSPYQESSILYKEPDDALGAELELEILDNLKTSIRTWRRVPSSFNNDISSRLSAILIDLEERKMNGLKVLPTAEYYKGIEGLCRGKRIFGHSLHFAFSTVDEIVQAIESTSIHENKHHGVEFSVGVKVIAYASNLFSTWVFVTIQIPE